MAEAVLTLYSRQGCHLCDEMLEVLRQLQGPGRFGIEVVDVDSDPGLARRHGERVPVLMHGAVELCHHRVDAGALASYLAKAG